MKTFIKSLRYAFHGLSLALKTERNLRIHVVVMVLAAAMGLYLKLSKIEWGIIILATGFVLVAELFNTAMERLGDDAANGNQKRLIKQAKDTAAAGVLLSAATALIIGIIYLLIPFIQTFL
jgi:diacylglycerol kinase